MLTSDISIAGNIGLPTVPPLLLGKEEK